MTHPLEFEPGEPLLSDTFVEVCSRFYLAYVSRCAALALSGRAGGGRCVQQITVAVVFDFACRERGRRTDPLQEIWERNYG